MQWVAIRSIAHKIGCSPETLRAWTHRAQEPSDSSNNATTDRERFKALERENQELRRTNEILSKASAFLHRRSSTAHSNADCVYRRIPRG
ncbi:MAG: transposase [Chromatiales bacterium]|nr:transposase [Chromatiales bacterium]